MMRQPAKPGFFFREDRATRMTFTIYGMLLPVTLFSISCWVFSIMLELMKTDWVMTAALLVVWLLLVGFSIAFYGSLMSRRMHDIGRSHSEVNFYGDPVLKAFGIWIFLPFIPGDEGDNLYGPPSNPQKWYHIR